MADGVRIRLLKALDELSMELQASDKVLEEGANPLRIQRAVRESMRLAREAKSHAERVA